MSAIEVNATVFFSLLGEVERIHGSDWIINKMRERLFIEQRNIADSEIANSETIERHDNLVSFIRSYDRRDF